MTFNSTSPTQPFSHLQLMKITRIMRWVLFVAVAVTVCLLAAFLSNLLAFSWSLMLPVVMMVIAPNVMSLLIVPRLSKDRQGVAWMACAFLCPILSYGAGQLWLLYLMQTDPVPQMGMVVVGVLFVMSCVIALGMLGHGVLVLLEWKKRALCMCEE